MPQNSGRTLEIAVESAAGMIACRGLADRIELCTGLDVGGLTPDIGLMAFAAASGLETHVLIRPRSGDFTMTAEDVSIARHGIAAARELGLAGIVIGAERDGRLDVPALEAMMSAAEGMHVTLHRVIDVLPDPISAVETAIALGLQRILTSGGAARAVDGIARLNAMHASSAGRIEIMAGGGISASTLPTLMRETAITAFHASCSRSKPYPPKYGALGFGASQRSLDPDELARLVEMLGPAGG